MENQQMLLAGIFAVVLLLVVMQFVVLVKITQIQNNQKRKQGGQNPVNNGKKSVNNPNKKHENRPNQNNNRPVAQNQANTNKQQANNSERKFERISSNAQTLKETNTQLASRPKPQQTNKTKVYSERTTPAETKTAAPHSHKQERPANTPIKQQELPKSEEITQEKPQIIANEKPSVETVKTEEVKTETASVQYGRR